MNYRVFLDKAWENLASAECEYAQARYNACANRAYYAMFQVAVAALLAFGIRPPGPKLTHKWVQASFSEQLIKRRKVYPTRLASDLMAVMVVRETADYEDKTVSRKMAGGALRQAKRFVETVAAKLEGGKRA